MSKFPSRPDRSVPVSPSRRRFVQGVASGLLLAGLGRFGQTRADAARLGPPTLRGTEFDLSYSYQPVNFTGQSATATAVNGSVPAPILRWREGDTVTLRVRNGLAVDSSIHWHGIILPSRMDGVPHISDGFKGIAPGETFTYRFKVGQSGTYWYHSHSGFQEQTGAYGAIVIDPITPRPYSFDREFVVQLSDWSDTAPETIYSNLKKVSGLYNTRERTFGELWREIRDNGVENAFAARSMWNDMRMSDRDISDVTGMTYTFLMNGVPPADGWLGVFKPGEKVLLRLINSAAMTFFDLRIPGLKMTVVAADGMDVDPVTVDEIRLGVAETYDVIVEPASDRPYTVFAQSIDRSGYARGTLTPNPAWEAEVPELDAPQLLTHGDMGMSGMGDMGMGGKCGAAMGMGGGAGHNMKGMEHSAHDMAAMSTTEHGVLVNEQRGMGNGHAGYGSARPVNASGVTMGPQVDMLAPGADYRLDDPGVGLRGNGRRVLLYEDLCNFHPTPDPREPSREIDLHLTGNMSRYMWSMNGIKFADADPLRLKFGERVRINLINDTMMNHPIHLHGMWSDLETGDPKYIPRKHTVIVQPGSRISYLVTADALGGWAYHCHLLYHMPGMFRHVIVA